MSKTAKQVILSLFILIIISAGVASYYFIQKQTLQKEKVILLGEVEKKQQAIREQVKKVKGLEEKIKQAQVITKDFEQKLSKFEGVDVDGMKKQIGELSQERDKWKERLERLQRERDDLLAKLKEKPKVIYKEREPEKVEVKPPPVKEEVTLEELGDDYWAAILKEKVSLELQVENIKKDLTGNAVEVVELKKRNSDLQLELSDLNNEKDSIEREIKYGQDLADSLSLELARAKNDNKFLNDRLGKIKKENTGLREQIKQLTSTKIALEKSIVRLQEEKKGVERKLMETENVIQTRIDEIWEIKDSIEKEFKPAKTTQEGEIELPPIVVSAQEPIANVSIDPNVGNLPGFDGNIVSVNEENNFVIVDIGETNGLVLGDQLNVYRGAEYIAGLEVIQIRKDIAAADIKTKAAPVKVGDVVR